MPSQNCPKCPRDTSVQACPYCGAGAAELWNRAAVTVEFSRGVRDGHRADGARLTGEDEGPLLVLRADQRRVGTRDVVPAHDPAPREAA
jgi:hypothetical protein